MEPNATSRHDVQQASTSTAPVKIVNLAPHEIVKKKAITPIKIYTGNAIYLELKEWKKKIYIGFSKEEEGAVRNRFNFEFDHFGKIEEALEIIKDHVRGCK